MTEQEKMLAGELYNAADPALVLGRRRARDILRAFNASRDEAQAERQTLLRALFGACGEGVYVEPPFFCDYGQNIFLGRGVYFNFNCVVLDPATVEIGDNTLFGPNVQLYTATHPLDHETRRTGRELARPIWIASDVWVGGGAIIGPGVRIGARSVVGAGSVVTRDVPADVFAAGSPCRVLRHLNTATEDEVRR